MGIEEPLVQRPWLVRHWQWLEKERPLGPQVVSALLNATGQNYAVMWVSSAVLMAAAAVFLMKVWE